MAYQPEEKKSETEYKGSKIFKPIPWFNPQPKLKHEVYETPYAEILFPEVWKSQPIKFNYNFWTFTSSRHVYPYSLKVGHEIIILWKIEYYYQLHKSLYAKNPKSAANIIEKIKTLKKNNSSLQYKKITNYEEFLNKYENTACTDWAKMDEHGNDFAGYWKYPDGSNEKENAWRLTYEANCKELYKLVTERNFFPNCIFLIIEHLCNFRCESVKQVKEFYEFFIEYVIEPNKDFILE